MNRREHLPPHFQSENPNMAFGGRSQRWMEMNLLLYRDSCQDHGVIVSCNFFTEIFYYEKYYLFQFVGFTLFCHVRLSIKIQFERIGSL
jgi:hypothetical protein